jgi:hypothetical protein
MTILRFARRTDPKTSHDAAASTTETKFNETQLNILAIYETYGNLTDEALVNLYWQSYNYDPITAQGIRTAKANLAKTNKVAATGELAITKFKRQAKIWGKA